MVLKTAKTLEKTAEKNGIWQQKLPKYKDAAESRDVDSSGFKAFQLESKWRDTAILKNEEEAKLVRGKKD